MLRPIWKQVSSAGQWQKGPRSRTSKGLLDQGLGPKTVSDERNAQIHFTKTYQVAFECF